MSKKVFIKTFGCQMNEYDSDKMSDVLHAAQGYEPTQNVDEADLILFNTCSVREKAQEKVFSDLGRIKHLKEKGVLIGVGGCVASQEGAAIIARARPMLMWCSARKPCTACRSCWKAARAWASRRLTSAFLKSKSLITCRQHGLRGPALLYPSWKAAPNTAATVWCLTPGVKKFHARLKTYWLKWQAWLTKA